MCLHYYKFQQNVQHVVLDFPSRQMIETLEVDNPHTYVGDQSS